MLLWLAERGNGATAKEVAFANRVALPTTYRILNTLLEQGLLAKDNRRRYVLGRATNNLVHAYLRGAAVSDGMVARLRELASRTGAAAYLADWGDHEMRTLASVEGADLPHLADIASGPLRDAHARASGKLLLAYAAPELRDRYLAAHPRRRLTEATRCDSAAIDRELERIRRQGYAHDDQEYAAGVSCVAAPVRRDGRITAALAVSVANERFASAAEELTAAILDVVQ
jgi:IclR family acetate operon transcriptional repressor